MVFVCFATSSPIGLNLLSLRYISFFFVCLLVCLFALSFFICVVLFCCFMLSCLRCAFFLASHFFNLLVFGFFSLRFFFVCFFGLRWPFHLNYTELSVVCWLNFSWSQSDLRLTTNRELSNVHAQNAKPAALFLTLLRSQSPVILVTLSRESRKLFETQRYLILFAISL